MTLFQIASRTAIGLAWTGVVASSVPVVHALRGEFRTESPAARAAGIVVPLDSVARPGAIRLDTATALIFVYSATGTAWLANTVNWLSLQADMRARHPAVSVFAVSSPQDSAWRPGLPASLGQVLAEYRTTSGDVQKNFGVSLLPATIVLQKGRVMRITYGIVGPRRRARLVALFPRASE